MNDTKKQIEKIIQEDLNHLDLVEDHFTFCKYDTAEDKLLESQGKQFVDLIKGLRIDDKIILDDLISELFDINPNPNLEKLKIEIESRLDAAKYDAQRAADVSIFRPFVNETEKDYFEQACENLREYTKKYGSIH